MRLIDADALKELLCERYETMEKSGLWSKDALKQEMIILNARLDCINEAPTFALHMSHLPDKLESR